MTKTGKSMRQIGEDFGKTKRWAINTLHDYEADTGLYFERPARLEPEQYVAFRRWFFNKLIEKYRLQDQIQK